MRKVKISILILLLAGMAIAQQVPANPITTQQITMPVFTLNPAPATNANISISGNPGPQTIYYWISANYLVGNANLAGPFPILNAPSPLSASAFVSINPTIPAGATTYDVLKTLTPIQPSGACACAVATAVAIGTVTNDQSDSTGAYTVAPANLGVLNMTLQNEVQGAGSSHLILRQNGIFVTDLSNVAGGPGAQTKANVANQWFNSYDAITGLFTSTQPAAANLSNGVTGSGAVALANSPIFVTQITAPATFFTATGGILTASVNAGGTGYAAGDLGTIHTGTGDAVYQVDTVSAGAVATFHLNWGGNGVYAVANAVATSTTTGAGSGFKVNILTIQSTNLTSFGTGTITYTFPQVGRGGASGFTFNNALNKNWLFVDVQNYSFENDLITNVTVAANVVTVTVNNAWNTNSAATFSAVGIPITISNLQNATFLNGQTLTTLTRSATQFTAAFTHANYGPTADTGTASYINTGALLGSSKGPLTINGQPPVSSGSTSTDPSYPSVMIGFGSGAVALANTADILYGLSIGWDIGGVGTTSGGNWNPSTGSGNFVATTIKPRINQTGSATGNYTILEVASLEQAATQATGNYLINAMLGTTDSSKVTKFSVDTKGNTRGNKFLSLTACAANGSAANPSVAACAAASAGLFSCATAASTGTCQVNTTAVTANSVITITPSAADGTPLAVTCNTTADTPAGPRLASKADGASFTINLGTVAVNPTCYEYTIQN